jgi:hypothetical protein|tara:strand:+ start:6847 stop:7278 length:432 start_codon:yes stop_codon:yes gene_type:complete
LESNKQDRGILLATFVRGADDSVVDEVVDSILTQHHLTNKYIFVFEDEMDPNRRIITYNAKVDKDSGVALKYFTIRIHRKKKTNTLYTINGLNRAIEKQHDGKTGKQYKLDWDEYENSIILTFGGDLKAIRLKLDKILEIAQD